MAGKVTSNKGKKEKVETDVILVVKGAGRQEEDVHLNLFLRGFWPAIKSLDSNATIAQIPDETGDNNSSPHNENNGTHKHITEIRAKFKDPNDPSREYPEKRIWLKESYWEYEVLPSTSLNNLSKEWQMASHVFANMFQDIFFTRSSKWLKEQREKKTLKAEHPDPTARDHTGNLVSYLLLFLLVLLPLGVAFSMGKILFKDSLLKLFPSTWTSTMGNFNGWYGFAFAILISAFWAIAPTLEISKMRSLRNKIEIKRLPGLPSWILILLILILVTHPLSYLYVLLWTAALQIAQLLPRRLLWKYRKYANSDVDHATYYEYIWKGKTYIGKVDEGALTRLVFSPLPYRYFVFLAIPLAFVITILANMFKWTKIFGVIGEALDGFVKFLLVGYLDDVVNYATDPAQAHRVRSVVMKDIKHFHELKGKKKVDRIHVIAHSQGTPITFEALFQFIEPTYQRKIYTYVTLGSILSYYHQARGILDLTYYNRFKMPIRDDKFPKDKFKWMNFWNFTDPITEFYGLDEYVWFKGWKKKTLLPKRGYTSPVNIRTRSSLLKNHGEYWDNLDDFQRPLAKRILGKDKPEEWMPDNIGKRNWHHAAVLLLLPVSLLLIAGAGYGAYWLTQTYLLDHFHAIGAGIQGLSSALFPPEEGAEPSLFKKLTDPANITLIQKTWQDFLSLSLIIITVWAALDWFGQIRRMLKYGKNIPS